MYLLRYKQRYGNWSYKETRYIQNAINRFRLYPEQAHSWAIYRISDMRCLAMSKDYKA